MAWMTCRCRFDSETTSSSTTPRVPTPGGGEVKQHRRAEAARADHQHARAAERGLSRPADLAQHDVARVTFKLGFAEHEPQHKRE